METDKEKLEHLLSGGLLLAGGLFKKVNDKGMIVYCKPNTLDYKESPGNCLDLSESTIYTEPMWWDSIPPEGILCKVWDNDIQKATYTTIYDYSEGMFRTKHIWYWNAVPLTEEQVAAYKILEQVGT